MLPILIGKNCSAHFHHRFFSQHHMPLSTVLIVPAYKPTPALALLLREMSLFSFLAIVVVDDGCGADYEPVFDAVRAIPGVHVIRHAVNLGKGSALRTGLNYSAAMFPEAVGFVTADADGQHLPQDVFRVAERLETESNVLVLGSRQFSTDIPWRSWFGNQVTRKTLHWFAGWGLRDTQTGLRGIPRSLALHLLRIPARGYEFELEMLTLARQLGYAAIEVDIETVYLDADNTCSHFHPVRDSFKIYRTMLRFCYHSAMAMGIEVLIFDCCLHLAFPLWLAQIVGKVFGPLGLYSALLEFVFHSIQPNAHVRSRFLTLIIFSGLVSYGIMLVLMSNFPHCHTFFHKALSELILFPLVFMIQRDWVFKSADTIKRNS
jgi:glycosyltransferase involved in cell wall biosynthesis